MICSMRTFLAATAFGVSALFSLTGCGGSPAPVPPKTTDTKTTTGMSESSKEESDLRTERAKLSPEDQRLVAAQEFCVISNEERLGAMGAPVKVFIKDQPVFLCCKGCQRKALANPEQTLAKLEELKTKVKSSAGTSAK